MVRRTLALLIAGAAMLASAVACSRGPAGRSDGKIAIVAAFYPLRFVADQVGGDAVAVTDLAKPGAEPHDLELEPHQVRQLADAALVVYLKGFQPAVDEGVAQNAAGRAFDVAAVEPLLDPPVLDRVPGAEPEPVAAGGKDPHVWLDPSRLATIGDRLADRLGAVDPPRAQRYRDGAAALRQRLGVLGEEYTAGLRTCTRREIVTSHAAFGYLADRFGLTQIAINGLVPEAEPSPQRLAAVADLARRHHATTIFFETLVSPKVAESLAREVGATTAVLNPIEGLEPGSGDDYFSVMRTNLATLRTALGCS